jgi:EAL domain-containing protein (putative c-di-GMP-specific phosphodiesterase class I)
VTGSIGIVVPVSRASPSAILRDADAAMYEAKAAGRNCYAVFEKGLHLRSVIRLAVEGELREALARHEFEVYYQPTVEPATGRPVGAEALIRWHHPTRGLVPPLEFIPVAEDSGLIKPIGAWVFEQAMSQLGSWEAQNDGPHVDVLGVNLSAPQLEMLALNLSARRLDDPETADTISRVLDRYGISPQRVCVEVTESVMMAES